MKTPEKVSNAAKTAEIIASSFMIAVLLGVVLFCGGFIKFLIEEEKAPLVQSREEKIDNIVRVFTHNPGQYSVLTLTEDNILKTVELNDVELVMDAPKDKPIYAIVTYFDKGTRKEYHTKTALHVHSAEDVNGGGWTKRVGKHTYSGQTNVIE